MKNPLKPRVHRGRARVIVGFITTYGEVYNIM
jgi:hypothetical protein